MTASSLALPLLDKPPTLPDELSGRMGTNRCRHGISQLTADTDAEAICAWLAGYDSANTLASHRREAERLWLWCMNQHRKPVSSLTYEDILVYLRFLADPQPADVWVTEGGPKPARDNPAWKPFYRPARKVVFDEASGAEHREPVLTEKSVRQARAVLMAMFSWLVVAGYLAANPVALSRSRKREKVRIERYLPPTLWQAVLAYVGEMPRGTKIELRRYHRARWLVLLFYLSGVRINEAVSNTMGCFVSRRSRDGVSRWWLIVEGKGNKERSIPVTSQLIAELTAYRRSASLAPLPSPGERVPLVIRYGPGNRPEALEPMSRSAVHVALKLIFKGAATRLKARGEPLQAAELERASAHWLRHTSGSDMADSGVDTRSVRDTLGHDNIATTNIYLHTEDDARHQEIESKFRVNLDVLPPVDAP